ncbi:MAG: histidine phosphatase family protein [bacterium]|nr:histidine phosphatase family protein [bacterium]
MTLPIDLVLVRHGQSEGNLAKRRSEEGDHSAYTAEFLSRHSASFRLTPKGRAQAECAGLFIREEFFKGVCGFDRYITSDYLRAMETAARLDLPGAEWFTDPYLTERDWGELDSSPQDEREERFGDALRRREVEPFFWRPPGGERFAELCLRVDRVLMTLHNECSDMRVIIVCHGEVIRAFQVRLERMTQARFKELTFSLISEDRIHNCQIVHYTRRDPDGKRKLGKYMGKVRWIRPTDSPITTSGWRVIERPRYTNSDLLEIVQHVPAMVT